jgi:hypothetical protein
MMAGMQKIVEKFGDGTKLDDCEDKMIWKQGMYFWRKTDYLDDFLFYTSWKELKEYHKDDKKVS